MARSRQHTQWAELPLVATVVGVTALLLTYLFRADLIAYVLAGASALIGISFLWAFSRRDVWWAVIPGVGLLAFAVACLAYGYLFPGIVWLGLLIMGLGAYVIAVIPNRQVWINAFYVLGVILVLVALIIAPIVETWKIILEILFALLFVLTLWADWEDVRRLWA